MSESGHACLADVEEEMIPSCAGWGERSCAASPDCEVSTGRCAAKNRCKQPQAPDTWCQEHGSGSVQVVL
eukprot:2357255-Rhodomonas_salina.2